MDWRAGLDWHAGVGRAYMLDANTKTTIDTAWMEFGLALLGSGPAICLWIDCVHTCMHACTGTMG